MVNSIAKSVSQINRYSWLIAVSGGMDSMALLHWAKCVKQNSNLRVIHIDHGIRVNSKLDGDFVKKICKTASIPYIGEKIPEKAPLANVEHWARNWRYQLIKNHQQKDEVVLTAHHYNDFLETILLQLFRSKSLLSLEGMVDWCPNRKLYRPWLFKSQKDLEIYAKKYDIEFRVDQSNFELKYLRNAIRRNLLPKLTKDTIDSLTRIADITQSFKAKNTEVHAKLPLSTELNEFPYPNSLEMELKLYASWPKYFPPFKKAWLELLAKKQSFQISEKWEIICYPKYLKVEKILFHYKTETFFALPQNLKTPLWTTHRLNWGSDTLLFAYKAYLSGRKIGKFCIFFSLPVGLESLCLRTRQAGDLFSPKHFPCANRKLKKFLQERSVVNRDSRPLLCSGKHVLWIPGVGESSLIHQASANKVVLRLVWHQKKN